MEPKIVASPGFTLSTWTPKGDKPVSSTMRSCFAKRVIKTVPAPPVEPFMELKQKKMASLVK